jgi:hypothetical protein
MKRNRNMYLFNHNNGNKVQDNLYKIHQDIYKVDDNDLNGSS